MKYKGILTIAIIAFSLSTVTFGQSMSEQMRQALTQRDENARSYRMIRDTMSSNSWSNLMRLVHHLQRVSSADSVILIEYADLYTSGLAQAELMKMKLDSLNIAPQKKMIKAEKSDISVINLVILGLAFAFAALGVYLYILSGRNKHVIRTKPSDREEELKKENSEYESKLAEISQVLAELTNEREKTASEIDELSKTLQRERQQRSAYAEHYEKLTNEYNHLKVNLETLLKENAELKTSIGKLSENNQNEPGDNLLTEEIEKLKTRLVTSDEEKQQLTLKLDELQSTLDILKKQETMKTSVDDQNSGTPSKDHDLEEMKQMIHTLKNEQHRLSGELIASQEKVKSLSNTLSDTRLLTGHLESMKDSLMNQLQNAREENSNLSAEVNLMKDQISKNEMNSEAWEKANSELTQAMQRIAEEEIASKKANEELQQKNEMIVGINASLQENQQLVAELKKSNAALNKRMKEIESELNRKNKLERDLKKLLSGGE